MKPVLWAVIACAAASAAAAAAAVPACDGAWQREVQARLGGVHGPDLGSAEWQAAVEHQLALRDTPERSSPAWCARVQQALDAARRAPVCRVRIAPGSIEGLTCRRASLATLDLQLAALYQQARAKAGTERPPVLAAEQRGWLRGRNDCWKAGEGDDARAACVAESYRQRILELQTRYRLVPVDATARWRCSDGSEVVMSYFNATQPPSLIAERGDQTSLMTRQPAASGTRYAGRNESFSEHQGEARVVWGWQAPELRCTRLP
jgi:uncharacterized protein